MGDKSMADEVIEGERCQECGVPMDGNGYPESCPECKGTPQRKNKGPVVLGPDIIRAGKESNQVQAEGHTKEGKGQYLTITSNGNEVNLSQEAVRILLPGLQRFAQMGRLTKPPEE